MHERRSKRFLVLLERVVLASDTIAGGTVLAPLPVDVRDRVKEVEAAVRAHMRMVILSGDDCA